MNIVQATRAHYAALQHRNTPNDPRVALDYDVTLSEEFVSGTIWVKAHTASQHKANLTRLLNRLQKMYPDATSVYVAYRR